MRDPDEGSDRNDSSEISGVEWVVNDIDEFLDTNTHLFVLISVFTAAGIYLQDLPFPETDPSTVSYENIVLFSSFGIVLFLLIMTTLKAYIRVDRSDYQWFRIQNYPYIIFFILLAPLVGAIFSYLTTLSLPSLIFLYASAYILMPLLVAYLYNWVASKELEKRVAEKVKLSDRFVAVLIQIVVLIVGLYIISQMPNSFLPNQIVVQNQNLDLAWVLFPVHFLVWLDVIVGIVLLSHFVRAALEVLLGIKKAVIQKLSNF